jgi:site-specific DNA recombinase
MEIGARVVEIIRNDQGVSGGLYIARPGIQRALSMLENDDADILIVAELDRLGRDSAALIDIRRRIQEAGKSLVFCDGQSYADTPEGDMLYGINGQFKQYEKAKIKERTTKGRLLRANDGIQVSRALSPLGYHIVTHADVEAGRFPASEIGTYKVVEAEANIVRMIFDLYSQGSSLRSVCRALEACGIKTPKSGNDKWEPKTVSVILSNPVYKGDARFGRRQAKHDETRPKRGFKVRYLRPSPDGGIRMSAPAIVEAGTWEICQQNLAANPNTLSGKRAYLVTGFLRCSLCGAKMVGQRGQYHCSARDQGNKNRLHTYTVVASKADSMVIDTFLKAVENPHLTRIAIQAHVDEEREAQQHASANIDRKAVETALANLAAKEKATAETAIRAVLSGADPAVFDAIYGEYKIERERLQAQLQACEPKLINICAMTETARLTEALAHVENALTSDSVTEKEKRALLGNVVESITLDKTDSGRCKAVDVNLKYPFPFPSPSESPSQSQSDATVYCITACSST